MAHVLVLGLLVPLLALFGCSSAPPCELAFAGDPGSTIEASLFVLDGSGKVLEPRDGDPVPLLKPPQGGYVIYAGVKLKNLDPCRVAVWGETLDPLTREAVTGSDRRLVRVVSDFRARDGDWFLPDKVASFRTLPNLPVCPSEPRRAVAGQPLLLEVFYSTRDVRDGRASRRVVPTCPPDAGDCSCVCGPGGC